MLIFLWGINYGYRLRQGTLQMVDHHPLDYLGALIDSYRALGWDIAVVNVGAAVDSSTVGSHPSCEGTRFIGNLLAHLVYSNLASSGEGCASQPRAIQSNKIQVPTRQQIAPNTPTTIQPNIQELWKDLFRTDAVVGSFTAWEPH